MSAAEAEPAHVVAATAMASAVDAHSELVLADIKPPRVRKVSYLT
jgi:hypothetical protein